MIEKFTISIVIPVKDDADYIPVLLDNLNQQTVLPTEIIIVDSSAERSLPEKFASKTRIVPLVYKKVNFAYPGHARNIGIKLASGEWIGIVDCKTVPEENWLEQSIKILTESGADCVCGRTFFEAETHFQKVLRAASYGCVAHKTLPGTVIKKESFLKSGGFLGNIRSSEDVEWLKRIAARGEAKIVDHTVTVMRYVGFPKSFFGAIRKYYKYAMATAQTDIFRRQKNIYLSVVLVLLTLIVLRWNETMTGFDEKHILYAPHITKIYLAILVFMYIVFVGFFKRRIRNTHSGLFEKVWLTILVLLLGGMIYKWNYIAANFNIYSVFYIPHITKIFLFTVFFSSILLRGVIQPLRRQVGWQFLFPFCWLSVGVLGLCLDIVKIPGYCWGAARSFSGSNLVGKA